MTERELLDLWTRARWHVIVSQFAPTFLLAVAVLLCLLGLTTAELPVRIAAMGILLASGILGALAQYSAAGEAAAVASELTKVPGAGSISATIIRSARWLWIVRYVTPAVFVVIFASLGVALFAPA
jgi:hypothetical protein